MKAAWHDMRVNMAAHPVMWPAARVLGRIGGVRAVPALGLVINDAATAHDVLSRDREFLKNGRGSIAAVMTQAFGPDALANMDGESHRRFRQRLGVLAEPVHAERWLAASEAPFVHALDALSRGETVDFSAVARAFSGRLTLALLGATPALPEAELNSAARDVHALGERIAGSLRLAPLSGGALERVQADHARLLGFARDAFASDDLPAESLVARLKALGCSEQETRGVLSIFFVAGSLTLGVAIPRLIALLADTDSFRRIRDEPELLNGAVDEGMRFICPVPATLRVAAHDTQVAGRPVRGGSRIVILTANCARDESLFPDGARFDMTRRHDPRARYLWFGAGPHFCMGFALAQRSLRHVIGRMAALSGGLEIARRVPAQGVLLPAWSRLDVQLNPRG